MIRSGLGKRKWLVGAKLNRTSGIDRDIVRIPTLQEGAEQTFRLSEPLPPGSLCVKWSTQWRLVIKGFFRLCEAVAT